MAASGDPLTRAQVALLMNQEQFGLLLGTSKRTVQRWSAGRSFPTFKQIATAAAAVHPRNAGIAAELAELLGHTLESLGIVKPAPPPAPSSAWSPDEVRSFAAEAVVSAAADALQLSPQAVRPAVFAMLERAKAARMTIDDLLTALAASRAEPAVDAVATAQPRGKKAGTKSEVR
jgi:hypothetical protein